MAMIRARRPTSVGKRAWFNNVLSQAILISMQGLRINIGTVVNENLGVNETMRRRRVEEVSLE